VLVDHFSAFGPAHIQADQFAFDGSRREPLVPQCNGEIGEPSEIARKGAGGLRARALAAIHVDGEPKHETDGAAFACDSQ
jgi:hypothetical protein